ncbi:endo-beta-N-acetylglucosaminidase [Bacteroides faecium]|uniref:Endo-beta-N-acetylglucosaminidase n=2 Tax=Bacteroides faecium TaxID=2715212 RepID=A0A6H0KWS6_9BACE|nr:endo-beta-N-acetylglucosaminidase [Bacteroides faecium]
MTGTLLLAGGFLFGACSNEEELVNNEQSNAQAVTTRTATGIKNIVYIEVNDINPLNAGSYTMNDASFFDAAIIFAANIRGNGDNVVLYNNPNVQAVLSGKAKYIEPLQAKGIKVLLSILGDHTGLGVANMTDAQVESFATQLANAVNTYGLDGIDFDDEWAEYGKNGYPSGSTGSFSKLITALRDKMPADKWITVFNYGYASELSSVADKINYGMNAFFGSYDSYPAFGMTKAKWAAYAINLNAYNSSYYVGKYAAQTATDGMGAICLYDLRDTSAQSTLNTIASKAFGSSVTYDGQSYSKDW